MYLAEDPHLEENDFSLLQFWLRRRRSRPVVFGAHCSALQRDRVYQLPGGKELFSPFLP